jgi:paraquat-inducible protein A
MGMTETRGSRRRLRACRECDLVQALPALHAGQKAECSRCGCTLVRRFHRPAQRSLALGLAALLALLLAVLLPLVSFRFGGVGNRIDLGDTATTLLGYQQPLVALAVAATTIVLPGFYVAGLCWLQYAILRHRSSPRERALARILAKLQPWLMADVFIIGALVSLIKIAGSADVGIGAGFWAFSAFALLLLWCTQSIDADWLWYSLAGEPQAPAGIRRGQSAAGQGCTGCHTCGLIALTAAAHHCERCGSTLHARVPHSLQQTMALLIAAALLYIPANVYPIMSTVSLGRENASTILGGVTQLLEHGSWPVALVIFIASVVVPVAKLLVLSWLCLASGGTSHRNAHWRTRLYRITEFVGRWSMVDVFVVALLVALIRADSLMSVYPGPAALAFCGVVILTMLAALGFDPRLVWDTHEPRPLEATA